MFWIWWQHGYDDKTFSGKVRRLLHHHQRLCSRQNSQVWKCYLDHGMRRYWRPSSTYPLIYTKTATQMEVTLDKAPRFSIRRVIWILLSDTICQLIQFYTNSEAALLSMPRRSRVTLSSSLWKRARLHQRIIAFAKFQTHRVKKPPKCCQTRIHLPQDTSHCTRHPLQIHFMQTEIR